MEQNINSEILIKHLDSIVKALEPNKVPKFTLLEELQFAKLKRHQVYWFRIKRETKIIIHKVKRKLYDM